MALAKTVVVEDERVVALHLRQQLTRLGYEVSAIATKGDQALDQIAVHRPDVVLMDIHIEGDMDGIDTALKIPDDWQVPVIYLTAYSEDSTLERARRSKPYGYLLKPFSERELHATIQMALERHRADIQLAEQTRDLHSTVDAKNNELAIASREIENQSDQRQKAEAALSQAQKMEAVGRLTGGLAHDFNNLMQVVVGNLGIITRIAPDDLARLRRAAESALQAAQKAVVVTQRLLAFAAQQPLRPKPVNVNGLVAGMSELLHRSLEESIGIRTVLGAARWLEEVDANQLESAVLNLAVNARDAMGGKGSLKIETRNVALAAEDLTAWPEAIPGDYVLLAVSDTGAGMDDATLARAFEPFFTTKEVGKGTGLGLSQVYGFVKQSGGYVKLESQVGRGMTATIYLPRFTGAAVEEPARRVASVNRVGSETILVVEDDDDVRDFSVEVLSEIGYRVLEAEDGPAALRILASSAGSVDLLFTDIVLPGGLNGVEVAGRALLIQPGLAILYTSGYDRNALSHRGRLDSGVELLAKPYEYPELSARVRELLDRRAKSLAAAHP